MLKLILATLLTLVNGCGSEGEKVPTKPYIASKTLKLKYNLYRNLVQYHQDADGFIDTKYCDATLWSGLLSVSGVYVNLEAALDSAVPGRWYRRPTSYPECWASGGSRSTISKDMLMGVMWWAVANERLDILEDLFAYGEDNEWFMGDGRLEGADTYMNPLWVSTLAECIHFLGGENHWAWRSVPQTYAKADGYSAHLQVLNMLLRRQMGVDENIDTEIVNYYVKQQPDNALFQYAAGNLKKAEALALNRVWWPDTRLPTTWDRKADWILQKDYGSDWKPYTRKKAVEHHGGDFLFIANLLISHEN